MSSESSTNVKDEDGTGNKRKREEEEEEEEREGREEPEEEKKRSAPKRLRSTEDLILPAESKDQKGDSKDSTEKEKLSEEEKRKAKERIKAQQEKEERDKVRVLVSNFTEDQLNRYEMFRRVSFPKAAIKRVMQGVAGTSVGHNVVIAMSGIAKVFAGEVVEAGLDYMEKTGEQGPLKPKHLREAVRKLREGGKIPMPRTKKKGPL